MKVCKCRLYHAIGVPCNCIPPYAVLMGFMAWLTTRQQQVTFSSAHGAAPAVNLLVEYCEKQGWDMDGNSFINHWVKILTPMG